MSAYVAYSEFLPQVLPYVHDCPDLVAIDAIRAACIEFCEETQYIVFEHTPVSFVAGQNKYTFTLPAETINVRVLEAWVNELPILPKSHDELKAMYGYDWRYVEGTPLFYTQLNPDELVVVPKPDVAMANALKMIVVIKPTRASSTVDGVLYEDYVEAIGFGARARLYDTPGQPYSDATQAVKFRGWFTAAMGKAKIDRSKGITRAVQVMRPPAFI